MGGLLGSYGSAYAVADRDQQKCINALNKDGAKVASKQGKENTACIKNAGKGKLPPMQSVTECLSADTKSKVAAAKEKTQSDFAKKCVASPPTFGIPTGTVVATVNDAAMGVSLALLTDLFGSDLDAAILDCAIDDAGCQCQQAVSKRYQKILEAKLREFRKCKKNALKAGKEPFLLGAMSAADLEKCVDDPATAGSIADDIKGKIDKRVAQLGGDIAKKCTGVDTQLAFPGVCAGLTGNALRDCIDVQVECRVCLMLNVMDNLDVDCDAFDDGEGNGSCVVAIVAETADIPSAAAAPNTPGTLGVTVTNPNLITQFGGSSFSLNNARYTRFHADVSSSTPDTILVLVPGFEGGANDFKILAENLIARAAKGRGLVVEVWAYDRRSNQLEDTEGLDIAESLLDPLIGLDWLFGDDLGLALHPALVSGPNRRAVFYNAQSDVPFIANWTPLVFSHDIDAVVEAARAAAKNQNVFLGGHSAGTGFTARYAATDFDLTGLGPEEPGYAKLRGLVLLEGGGGSTGGAALTADTLDRIEAKYDGGLFGAVRDNANRCVDGTTACTIATEAADCVGQIPPKCTPPTTAYSIFAGLLNPQILAAVEPAAIQGVSDPDGGQIILQVDQGGVGNNAVAMVPELATLAVLPQSTVLGGIGSFVDDDGAIATLASFVATSVGAVGPVVGGLTTWQDITETVPPSALPDNGPQPTSLPSSRWGQEKEVTRFDRMLTTFFAGGSNFTDWYYPSSGLSTTSVSGVCTASVCTVGNVGASCTMNGECSQAINLDSTDLSVGRGRRDIENLTQAANIDIPVIGFGGSNGLVEVPADFLGFAQSIDTCAATSCDGTVRVVDAVNPNPAFPTFGEVDGGFEVYISEGFAHVDVLTAEDDVHNNVLRPLVDFLERNSVP
jgi:pimeloyl-ACP methyl ester carboxylesterase